MSIQKTKSEVLVFYDETEYQGEKLKGHILLFIPNKIQISNLNATLLRTRDTEELNPLHELFSKIKDIRKEFGANHKFHFSEISGKKWTKFDEAARKLVSIGVDALRHKRSEIFKRPLHCKVAVIFSPSPTPDNLAFYGGNKKDEKKLRYNETILRMLLKGALHYLYDENSEVEILKIITDGEPVHRRLSEERILQKLIEESLSGNLKKYVKIYEEAEIIHQDSDHKKHDTCSNEYIYANMLQLADMLLGSIVQSCLKGIKWQNFSPRIGRAVNDKKSIIAYPVKEMLDKRKRGEKFKHSGHYKSFTISKGYIKNGKWEFENITSKEIEIDTISSQLTLFNF